MPDGLGPNPFRRKKPPEEERKVPPPVTPVVEPPTEVPAELPVTRPVVSPIGLAPPPTPPKRAEDIKFTEGGIEYTLKDDMSVWARGKQVATYDSKTDKFTPIEPSFWQKAGYTVLRGLEYGLYAATLTGIGGKYPQYNPEARATSLAEEDIRKHYKGLPEDVRKLWKSYDEYMLSDYAVERYKEYYSLYLKEQRVTEEDWGKDVLPGGELYKRFRELPIGEQFLYESPFWAYLSVAGISGIKLRGALAPAVAKPGVATIPAKITSASLYPLAQFERLVGYLPSKVFQKLAKVRWTKTQVSRFAKIDAQVQKVALQELDDVLKANPLLAAKASPDTISRIAWGMDDILRAKPYAELMRTYGLTGLPAPVVGSPASRLVARGYAEFALTWATPAKSTVVVNLLKGVGLSEPAIMKMTTETAWRQLVSKIGLEPTVVALVKAYIPEATILSTLKVPEVPVAEAVVPPAEVAPITPEVALVKEAEMPKGMRDHIRYELTQMAETQGKAEASAEGWYGLLDKETSSVWAVNPRLNIKIKAIENVKELPDNWWEVVAKHPNRVNWQRELIEKAPLGAKATQKKWFEWIYKDDPRLKAREVSAIAETVTPEVAPAGIAQKQWASFWIKTQGMGLTSAEVHEALGVVSVKDWIAKGKTLEQALKTLPQLSEAHKIAIDKALIDAETGKLSSQYRRLAQNITGKKSIDKMTSDEVNNFIVALDRYPDKKWSAQTGKWIAQTMPTTKAMVPENYFGLEFKEPTPIKYFTSQNYYATKLGVGELTRPLELAKQKLDLEYPAWTKAVESKIKELNKVYKVTMAEKLVAIRNNVPTSAVKEMAELLNEYEDPPATLSKEKAEMFMWFRNVDRTILAGENRVRELLDMPPIPYRRAYLSHVANQTAREIMSGNYSLPADLAYWSKQIVGKKIFNPMEIQRRLADDLLEHFSKDLTYATKSMIWTGLKEIHLSQPLRAFTSQLNVLSKGMVPFSSLSTEEIARAQAVSVLPASTRKWLIDYVNVVIKGQQTELDASINRIITQSGIGGLFDKFLNYFGRSVGTRPVTKMAQFSGRIVISATIGTKPRQIIRNLFQSTQNLALYGVEATLKAFLPAGKTLTRLLDKSMFLKSYARYEELPVGAMAKAERIWLWAYGKSAIFNARTGMKASYHGTIGYITNARNKGLGWADPARTYTEPKGFLYDSEAEKLLREMEFGAGATQYQYIAMGMPEIFRHKTLIPFTRLQSWWMNYFAKFNREALHRFWNGSVGWDPSLKLPASARLNWMKYLILGGAVLTALGYSRSFMKDVLPHWGAPATQFIVGAYNYIVADSDYKREQAKRTMYYSINAFVPGMIDYKSWEAVWTGEKPMDSLFFYGEDWQPDMPTWGIPPLVEEVAIGHAIEYANEEVPKFREKLGTLIPAEDDIEEYIYEMSDFAAEIRALIRDIPDERVTEDNFSDIVAMYKQAETLWDTYYYALPAGQRQAWLQQTTPESILTGAYLALWGRLKVTGWVSGNPQTIALIKKLVSDYNIPPDAIPSLGELTERRITREEPTIEPAPKPREEGLGPNPFR